VVYTYKRRLFRNKKDEVLIYTKAWMNLENISLNERSQSQKTTGYLIAFILNVLEKERRLVGFVELGKMRGMRSVC
jgi:hypothetical protein